MKKIILLFALTTWISSFGCLQAFSQKKNVDTTQEAYNQKDNSNRKQGFWITKTEAHMGEPAKTEFGNYINDRKEGTWYNLDFLGRLVSIETFHKGVRDGECHYFEKGRLILRGSFRGLNPDAEFDTFYVINPVSLEEVRRIFPSEQGSVKHGTWFYYNSNNGAVIKEEEYQVGDLLYTRDYYYNQKMDSAAIKKLEATMPHMTDPTGEKGARNIKNKSLIR